MTIPSAPMEVAFFLPLTMLTGTSGAKLANADCQTVFTIAGQMINAGRFSNAADAVARVFPTLGSSARMQRFFAKRNFLDTF